MWKAENVTFWQICKKIIRMKIDNPQQINLHENVSPY